MKTVIASLILVLGSVSAEAEAFWLKEEAFSFCGIRLGDEMQPEEFNKQGYGMKKAVLKTPFRGITTALCFITPRSNKIFAVRLEKRFDKAQAAVAEVERLNMHKIFGIKYGIHNITETKNGEGMLVSSWKISGNVSVCMHYPDDFGLLDKICLLLDAENKELFDMAIKECAEIRREKIASDLLAL